MSRMYWRGLSRWSLAADEGQVRASADGMVVAAREEAGVANADDLAQLPLAEVVVETDATVAQGSAQRLLLAHDVAERATHRAAAVLLVLVVLLAELDELIDERGEMLTAPLEDDGGRRLAGAAYLALALAEA